MFHRHSHRHTPVRVGLRTLKTALAVMLTFLLISLVEKPTIFAALAAMAVMSPTFEQALRECKVQGVGILIGGILGILTVKLVPQPSIWLMGVGVTVIMSVCAARGLGYAAALSCTIFLSSCLNASDTVMLDTLTRLLHTATGLVVGLAVNTLILPYNNRPRIIELLQQSCKLLGEELCGQVLLGRYPDLSAGETLIDRIHYELRIYTHRVGPARADRGAEIAYLSGCLQLAERMLQELHAMNCMDAIGLPSPENHAHMLASGLSVPSEEAFSAALAGADAEDDTVLNYHLTKLLGAHDSLLTLLAGDEAQDTTDTPEVIEV